MCKLYYHDYENENIYMPYFWFSGPVCSAVTGLPLQIKGKGKQDILGGTDCHPGRSQVVSL